MSFSCSNCSAKMFHNWMFRLNCVARGSIEWWQEAQSVCKGGEFVYLIVWMSLAFNDIIICFFFYPLTYFSFSTSRIEFYVTRNHMCKRIAFNGTWWVIHKKTSHTSHSQVKFVQFISKPIDSQSMEWLFGSVSRLKPHSTLKLTVNGESQGVKGHRTWLLRRSEHNHKIRIMWISF